MNTAIAYPRRAYSPEAQSYETTIHRGALWKIILPCVIVMFAGLSYIWLQSATERLHREISRLEAQQENTQRQLANLRIERETQTSRQKILERVAQFNLELRPPTVGQTRRITLRDVSASGQSSQTEDNLLALTE